MRTSTAALLVIAGAAAGCTVIEPAAWTGTVQPRAGAEVEAAVQANTMWSNTAVAISMIGGEPGGQHPWHIHEGTCESGGGIVGDPDAYPPLAPDATGGATADARLRTHLMPDENYHVNVHRSPDAMGEIIACGDLAID